MHLTVCYYHVAYVFQSESALYSVDSLTLYCAHSTLWRSSLTFGQTIVCGFILKLVRGMIFFWTIWAFNENYYFAQIMINRIFLGTIFKDRPGSTSSSAKLTFFILPMSLCILFAHCIVRIESPWSLVACLYIKFLRKCNLHAYFDIGSIIILVESGELIICFVAFFFRSLLASRVEK